VIYIIIISALLFFLFRTKKEINGTTVLSNVPVLTSAFGTTAETPLPPPVAQPDEINKITPSEKITTTAETATDDGYLLKPVNDDVSILDLNSGFVPVTTPPKPIEPKPVTTTQTTPVTIVEPKPVSKPATPVPATSTTVTPKPAPVSDKEPVSIFPAAGGATTKLIKAIY